jgi:NitT/TauT family transport system substrate-binding protein
VKRLRAGYLSTFYHTSHLLRAEDGMKKDSPLEVTWTLFPTGPAMVEAFSSGDIDIGYIGLPPAMIGIGRGIPLRCIAGGHIEGTVVIGKGDHKALPEAGSASSVMGQLKGKAVATPTRGSIHDVILRDLLHRENLNRDVQVENFTWADLIPEAFDEGRVDGAVGTPPLAVLMSRECDTKIVIPPGELWPFNPSYGVVVREEVLGEKELLEDFVVMHEAACNLIREKPDVASRTVACEVRAVPEDFVLETYRISPKYCASLPKDYTDSTMAFIPVLKRMGYLERSLRFEEVFDLFFVERAHRDASHYTVPGKL